MQNSKIANRVHLGTDRNVDTRTGEIIDIIHRKRWKPKKQLKFILLMENKSILKELSGSELKIFLAFALRAEMDTGYIYTNSKNKQEVADEIGLTSAQTVADIIPKLVEKGYFIKVGKGMYQINEEYAWRGTTKSAIMTKNEREEGEGV